MVAVPITDNLERAREVRPPMEIVPKRLVPLSADRDQTLTEALIAGNAALERGHHRAIASAERRFNNDQGLTGLFEMPIADNELPIMSINSMLGKGDIAPQEMRERLAHFANFSVSIYHPKEFIRNCLLQVAKLRAGNMKALKWNAPMYTTYDPVNNIEQSFDFSSHDAHSYHVILWATPKDNLGSNGNGTGINRIPIGSVRINYPQVLPTMLNEISNLAVVTKAFKKLHMLAATDLDTGYDKSMGKEEVSSIEKLLSHPLGVQVIANAALGRFNTPERLVTIDYTSFKAHFPNATKVDYTYFLSMIFPALMTLTGSVSLKTGVPLGLVQTNDRSAMMFNVALGPGVHYISTVTQKLVTGDPDSCHTLIIEYPRALEYTKEAGSDMYPFAGKVMGLLEEGRLLNGNAVES